MLFGMRAPRGLSSSTATAGGGPVRSTARFSTRRLHTTSYYYYFPSSSVSSPPGLRFSRVCSPGYSHLACCHRPATPMPPDPWTPSIHGCPWLPRRTSSTTSTTLTAQQPGHSNSRAVSIAKPAAHTRPPPCSSPAAAATAAAGPSFPFPSCASAQQTLQHPRSSSSASAREGPAAAAAAAAGTRIAALGGAMTLRQLGQPSSIAAAASSPSSSSCASSSRSLSFPPPSASSSSSPSSGPFPSWFVAGLSYWKLRMARTAQVLQYQLMLLFRLPLWGKLLALVMVGLPIVLLGSWLLVRATQMAWWEAAQTAFYVLQNVPGADVTRFPDAAARLVLVIIHLLSLYTFATLVGLLTEDVRSTVEEIRSGNFPIPSQKHTVLLDLGVDPSRLIATLQKVLDARESHGAAVYAGDISILSTQSKDELDKMITDVLSPKLVGRVVTRHGNPIKVSDLERVAALHARTVLLLAPDRPMGHVGIALQQQLCLTALRSLHTPKSAAPHDQESPPNHNHRCHRHHTRHQVAHHALAATPWPGGDSGSNRASQDPHHHHHHHHRHHHQDEQHHRLWRQHVVVENSSVVMSTVAAGELNVDDPLRVTYVSSASSTSRVAVQCAVQPGLAAVFDAVFSRSADASLRVVTLPSGLEGRTFAEVRRRFRRAVLCGLLPGAEGRSSNDFSSSSSSSGRSSPGKEGIMLSPSDDWLLQRSDRLLLLAAAQEDCVPVVGEMHVQAPPPLSLSPRYDGQRSRPSRLVLLVLDSCLSPGMLAALDEFGAPGCRIVVVSPKPCSGLPSGPTTLHQLVIRNEVGDPLSPGPLLAADVVAADAVILTGTYRLPPDEADAAAIGVALMLQRLVDDPWVMSHAGAEEFATVVAVAASIDAEQYWGAAVPSSGNSPISSITSVDVYKPLVQPLVQPPQMDEQRQPPPSRPLAFVCSVKDPQNRSVLQYIGSEACRTAMVASVPGVAGGVAAAPSRGLSIEVMEPQALISGMLAQVGAEPLLVSALEDLLDEEGYELYIKRCDRYGLAPYSHVSWAQVSEVIRADGEVALGYLHRGRLHLAPFADMELLLLEGDKLVVLSEGF